LKARFKELLDKSIAAMVAAIEVYNKPDFRYREETFSVIAVNAWELACKAYVLKLKNNRLNSIYVYERKNKKDGTPSKKWTIKTSKSGNPITHSLGYTLTRIETITKKSLPTALKANIESLGELRDNAIHFYNRGLLFTKRLQEIGSATLKNYVQALQEWFEIDLSKYNFYLMPISFFTEAMVIGGLILNKEEERFLNFINIMEEKSSEPGNYDVTVNINISFIKSNTSDAIKVQLGKGKGAAIQLTEEQIRDKYPWDYGDLVEKMKERYTNFKLNQEFHDLRKAVIGEERYVRRRYLDPGNPKSSKKDFYNTNILRYFDNHYNKTQKNNISAGR
jgi:hypothetical protein